VLPVFDLTANFVMHSQNCKKRLLVSSFLSVQVEKLGLHWMAFHKIWYLRIFPKSVDRIQVWFKS